MPTEWTCGHTAGAMCQECFHILAGEAHNLATSNARLRDALTEAIGAYTGACRLGGARGREPDNRAIERWRKAMLPP